jgi:hypothetical protein
MSAGAGSAAAVSVGFVCGDLACDAELLDDREPVVRRHDPLVASYRSCVGIPREKHVEDVDVRLEVVFDLDFEGDEADRQSAKDAGAVCVACGRRRRGAIRPEGDLVLVPGAPI